MNEMACADDDDNVDSRDEDAQPHEDFPTNQVADGFSCKEHKQRDNGKAGLRFSIFFGGHVSRLDECGVTCDGSTHNEGVHLPGSFVAIERLSVSEEAGNVIIEHDSVAT